MKPEEIDKIASAFAIDEVKDTCNPASKRGLLYVGFITGAKWADAYPHWISVDEQDIPLGQWVITYAPNEDNYCKIDVELLAMDETAEDFGITHWMPLPQSPKEGGEK